MAKKWHIQCEVGAPRFETVMDALHTLRVDGLVARPIHEGPGPTPQEVAREKKYGHDARPRHRVKRTPSGRLPRGTIDLAVMERLEKGPVNWGDVRDVAENLGSGTNPNNVLKRLIRSRLVRKKGKMYHRVAR